MSIVPLTIQCKVCGYQMPIQDINYSNHSAIFPGDDDFSEAEIQCQGCGSEYHAEMWGSIDNLTEAWALLHSEINEDQQ